MRISVAEAGCLLTELVGLANQGEEVVLTQDGLATVRLQPMRKSEPRPRLTTREEKARLLDRLQAEIRENDLPPGPDPARSQDFLYDEHGMPR